DPGTDGGPRRDPPEQLNRSWEAQKAEERRDRGLHSAMDDIPRGLAPLLRAGKLQKRAAGQGFDWSAVPPVLDKLQEEIDELERARAIESSAERRAAIRHELGDVLFTCVNLARKLEVDPEIALVEANMRFERRYRAMERAALAAGNALAELDDAERERLWEQAKLHIEQASVPEADQDR
ncbi:MAG: nucleoside triphosphate pyrophosphohydrolase, partial [Gammaproteobacteria bacterium]|nr:nucleoside triphosphate pyrophosphohydrolase [Gammaproteobacteria bacterium]